MRGFQLKRDGDTDWRKLRRFVDTDQSPRANVVIVGRLPQRRRAQAGGFHGIFTRNMSAPRRRGWRASALLSGSPSGLRVWRVI